MPTAYSYCRFSDAQQEQGSSLARQIKKRDEWLARHPEYVLDTTIRLRDLGVSAFRGRNLNPAYGDLGKFIDLCERENSPIEKGSVLLLEKLDRFSRDKPMLAISALTRLIYAGVTVIATEDSMELNEITVNDLQVAIPVVVNLCIAHEQSKEKSYRVGEAWNERRKKTRETGELLTKKLPAWLFYDDEKKTIEIDKEAEKAIQYIFKRTIDGIGQVVLCRELNEKFKPITKQNLRKNCVRAWNTSYLSKLLQDRNLFGEFQPKTKDDKGRRIDCGKPIKNYYPAVITEDQFYAAQYQKKLRKHEKSDSETGFVNLFQGLVIDRMDKSVMQIQTTRTKRTNGDVYIQRRLCSYAKRRGLKGATDTTIDYYSFESLIIDSLNELNPKDFEEKFDSRDQIRKLHEEIEGAKVRLIELEEMLANPESESPVKNIAESISRINNMIEIKKGRVDALANVGDTTGNGFEEGLRTLDDIKAKRDCYGDKNLRTKIRSIIPTIIDRISVRQIKLSNKKVIAVANIYLTNGDLRYAKLFDASEVIPEKKNYVFLGDDGGALKLTSNGSIEWNPKRHNGKLIYSVSGEGGSMRWKLESDQEYEKYRDYVGKKMFEDGQKRTCTKKDLEIYSEFRRIEKEVWKLRVDGFRNRDFEKKGE